MSLAPMDSLRLECPSHRYPQSRRAFLRAWDEARRELKDWIQRQQEAARQRDRALVALKELEDWASPMPGSNQAAPMLRAREVLENPYGD